MGCPSYFFGFASPRVVVVAVSVLTYGAGVLRTASLYCPYPPLSYTGINVAVSYPHIASSDMVDAAPSSFVHDQLD